MATPCKFSTDCSFCYNRQRCSSDTCLGFVPKITEEGEILPLMFINNTACGVDCPYIQACYEATEWYIEEKTNFTN